METVTNLRFMLIFIIIISCNTNDDNSSIEYFKVPSKAKISIKPITYTIDTIQFDNTIETSFKGDFHVVDNQLFFTDKLFNYVFQIDYLTKKTIKYLGKGNGNNEIKGFSTALFTPKKYFFLSELKSQITLFHSNFKKINEYKINWQITRSQKEVLKKPIYDVGDSYEFDFGIPNIFQIWDNNHFIMSITTSHPKFNGYFDSENYYKYSRILTLIDIKTGKVEELFGRRSPIMLHRHLPNFDHFSFETVKNELIINFNIDSVMYAIDKKTKLAKYKFGIAGKNMNTNYVETNSYLEAKNRWRKDREEYGYYTYIKYIPSRNWLFRGYQKNAIADGLQIYQDNVLIADIDVSKNLKIIGTIDNSIIAYNTKFNKKSFEIYKISFTHEK